MRVLARPDDARPGETGFQFAHVADVVVMMVGEPDVSQGPAFFGERRENGLGLRRVERRGRARGLIMGEETEIVRQAQKLMKFDRHGALPFRFDSRPRQKAGPRR